MTDLVWVISSSVMIAVVTALRAAFGGRLKSGVRMVLWALVLIRLLIPGTLFSSPVGVASVVTQNGTVEALDEMKDVDRVTYSEELREMRYERDQVIFSGSFSIPDVVKSDVEPEEFERIKATFDVKEVLSYVWLAGAAVTSGVFLVTNLSFYMKIRRRRRRLDIDCKTSFIDVEYKIPVYVADGIESPFLFGSSIYVDEATAGDGAALRHVLAHEASHYRHRDNLTSVARCLALALHWYNPLVWIAAVLSRRDADLFADDGAIKTLGEEERAEYGKTLVDLTVAARRAPIFNGATMMAGGSRAIFERVKRIAKKPKTSAVAVTAVILVAALALVFVFVGKAEDTVVQDQKTADTEQVGSDAEQTTDTSPETETSPVDPETDSDPETEDVPDETTNNGKTGSDSDALKETDTEVSPDPVDTFEETVEKTDGQTAEQKTEIAPDYTSYYYPQLTEEIIDSIKKAYMAKYPQERPEHINEWVRGMYYYGEYGTAQVFMYSGTVTLMLWEETVAGLTIHYCDGRRILALYNGELYTLPEAYDNGVLTVDQLRIIQHLHEHGKYSARWRPVTPAESADANQTEDTSPEIAESYVLTVNGEEVSLAKEYGFEEKKRYASPGHWETEGYVAVVPVTPVIRVLGGVTRNFRDEFHIEINGYKLVYSLTDKTLTEKRSGTNLIYPEPGYSVFEPCMDGKEFLIDSENLDKILSKYAGCSVITDYENKTVDVVNID